MRKNKVLIFTKILCMVFIIWTIIAIFITYKHIDSSIAFKFLMGYVLLTLFMLLYITLITILNSRKLKWVAISKRLIKFVSLFILFGTLNYILDFFFRPLKIDLLREFSTALGVAFSISFIDIIFLKKKENQKR